LQLLPVVGQAQAPQFRQPVGQLPRAHFPLPTLWKLFCEPVPRQCVLPPQPPAVQTQAPQPVQPGGQALSEQPPFEALVPLPPGLLVTWQLAGPPQLFDVQAQEPQL
jgi:hypothetical protein